MNVKFAGAALGSIAAGAVAGSMLNRDAAADNERAQGRYDELVAQMSPSERAIYEQHQGRPSTSGWNDARQTIFGGNMLFLGSFAALSSIAIVRGGGGGVGAGIAGAGALAALGMVGSGIVRGATDS